MNSKEKDTEIARPATQGFSGLGLTDALVKSVAALGYEEATPIQREAIPVLLAGKDIIGQAGTGTGKTAAFALPLLHRLIETPASDAAKPAGVGSKPAGVGSKTGAVRAMVLVPTRELAIQVAEAIHKYAKQTSLTVVPLYGGAPMDQQIRALRRGVDIVVATPGRALDHLRRQTLDLTALEVLVLDEADEMLDMGFAEDLEAILTSTPETRQTALFAATMAPRIASIAERHLRKPERITIKAEKRAPGKMPLVRQVAYMVSRQQKSFALGRILEFEDPTSAMVFCRTRIEVDELTDTLKSHGYGAQALHGGLDQRQRDRVMQLFRSGKSDILVATDVAARGLDIEHVSHVINYDIPTAPEVYIHRIGRTGRIGREGVAITLVDPREQRSLRYIETLIKQKIDVATLPTLAALKAKRLDATRAALITRITAGDLDETRALVQSLAEDFEMVDIAAASLAMFQAESDAPAAKAAAEPPPEPARPARTYGASPSSRTYGAPASTRTYSPAPSARPYGAAPSSRPPRRDVREDAPRREAREEAPRPRERSRGEGEGTRVVLAFSVGKDDGVRPADLVGAITGEAGVTSRDLGAIRINADFSTVEVSEALAAKVLKVMKGKTVRGEKVDVKAMS